MVAWKVCHGRSAKSGAGNRRPDWSQVHRPTSDSLEGDDEDENLEKMAMHLRQRQDEKLRERFSMRLLEQQR